MSHKVHLDTVLICGGMKSPRTLDSLAIQKPGHLIAVDRGARFAFEHNLTPHIIIGDLDSIGAEVLKEACTQNIPIQKHPEDKDATDLEIALDHALSYNPQSLILTCALGERIDHTFGNLLLLNQDKYAHLPSRILEDSSTGAVLRPHHPFEISGSVGDIVSIIPLTSNVHGVTTHGLQWPLRDAELRFGSSYSLSNACIENNASITIRSGTCLAFHIPKQYA